MYEVVTMREWIEQNRGQFSTLLNATQALGTCLRLKVGALIIMERDGNMEIVGSGCNTALPGQATCEEEEKCLTNRQHRCVRTVHAEHNAIVDAIKRTGGKIEGATLLCTHEPCENCVKLIESFGISQVLYVNPHDNKMAKQLRSQATYTKIEL